MTIHVGDTIPGLGRIIWIRGDEFMTDIHGHTIFKIVRAPTVGDST